MVILKVCLLRQSQMSSFEHLFCYCGKSAKLIGVIDRCPACAENWPIVEEMFNELPRYICEKCRSLLVTCAVCKHRLVVAKFMLFPLPSILQMFFWFSPNAVLQPSLAESFKEDEWEDTCQPPSTFSTRWMTLVS